MKAKQFQSILRNHFIFDIFTTRQSHMCASSQKVHVHRNASLVYNICMFCKRHKITKTKQLKCPLKKYHNNSFKKQDKINVHIWCLALRLAEAQKVVDGRDFLVCALAVRVTLGGCARRLRRPPVCV